MKKVSKVLKSLSAFALSVMMMFAFCACSGGKNPEVSDIVTAITEQYPLSDKMTEVTSESTIENTLGIAKSDYSDIAVYINNSGVEQDELIIVKANDKTAADNISDKLETRLESKLTSTKNYLPEQYEIVEKCKVDKSGSYVALIVSENADDMNKIFEEQVN